MGYIHDTQMSNFVSANDCMAAAGTWIINNYGNIWFRRRSASASTFVFMIPLSLQQNAAIAKGSKINSVDILFEISTQAFMANAAAMYKAAIGADGATVLTPTLIITTYDAGHDTAGERIDIDQHKMTLTVTIPEWMDINDTWYIEFAGNGDTNSIFDLYGAVIHYTLRL